MKAFLTILLVFSLQFVLAQEHAWIYFSDKPNEATYLANPLTMLSQRALDRRTRQNITLDSKDVPISNDYINQVNAQSDVEVKAKSKWLNAVHVYGSQTAINALSSLSFVSSILYADNNLNTRLAHTNAPASKFEIATYYNYGDTYDQAHQIRADFLHETNFTGTSMQIAILDAGFPGVDTFDAFQKIRDNNQILGGYNYVDRSTNFYQASSHGTSVLSTIAGFVEDEFVGTAPDAKFYLFITEDAEPESPLEESLWVEAAEKVDSLGVDVINTSLGYQDFDESRYNHSYSHMDGQTTFIARGANIAAERGILVVVSAGNDGNNTYFNISTPADATNVFTVGAVASDNTIANFSSYGPSSDGRIKPDVCARGASSVIINSIGEISTGSGTSFSSPIMAGAIACFWEAFPNKTNFEIMQMIRESAHLYDAPTDQEGYGIPNLELAYHTSKTDDFQQNTSLIYPNPTDGLISFNNSKKYHITLFNILGKQLMAKNILIGEHIDLTDYQKGVYLLSINDGKHTEIIKIIKK